ncbi:MAG TPA: Calx-beta domain-containing protein, partial [Verrucomicrobiae bacterium]|nr:Calx-beta domain-containing protein [Verrucomicrobiae bacterium]
MKRILFVTSLVLLVGLSVLWTLRSPRNPVVSALPRASAAPLADNLEQPSSAPTHIASALPRVATPPLNTNSSRETNAFSVFNDWMATRRTNASASTDAQGEALAWKRREAMLQLIQNDPERALAHAAPFAWRQQLPSQITRHLETWVDGRGSFEVAMAQMQTGTRTYRWVVIGEQRYDAFVYGRLRTEPSRTNVPLHGIVLDNKMAVSSEPVRKLDSSEAARRDSSSGVKRCRVCLEYFTFPGDGVAAELGGEVGWFCSPEHLQVVNSQWKTAAFAGRSAAQIVAGGGSSWTFGRKTLLYIRVNFPDDLTEPVSEADAYNTMNAVNHFYTESSYNQTWITTTVTPLVTVRETRSWYSTAGPSALLSHARDAARKAGFDTANYDLDIVSHTSVPGYDWAGLGAVGGKGTWLQAYDFRVTAHELGHNYGILHANFWDTTTNLSSVVGVGTNREYGNVFDTMGAAGTPANHFNAVFKGQLDWLSTSSVHDVTTNGVFRMYPLDLPERINGRKYAARIRKDFERDYWLELRHRFTNNVSIRNGVLLNWSPWSGSDGGTDLLDTTPETPNLGDSAVVIGRTFTDPVGEVHITPIGRSQVNVDPWIDVRVQIGSDPLNLPPFLAVEISQTNVAPNQPVSFHATATDRNNDSLAYFWRFDDGTFSTNNQPWILKGWSAPGEHVVRCEVSDMKGGRASVNALVTVGQPQGFRVSGIILDANDDPIEGVRVDNGADGQPGDKFSFTDSDGYFVLPGLSGDLMLAATKYGYSFTNLNGDGPMFVEGNTNVNFLALPQPTLRITVTTNRFIENAQTNAELRIARTGSTNEDQTLTLWVAGSAELGNDINVNPALTSGSNSVVIPAGEEYVTFTVSPVNNTITEATETMSFTLIEDPSYPLTAPGEARITVIDDDSSAVPLVTLGVHVSQIVENGIDSAAFVFSRSGSTASPLQVVYNVSGSATAGTDYPTLVGVLVIPAGSSSARLEFKPHDDKDVEADETVTVTLSPNPAYTGGGAAATTTIIDDDLLVVSASPASRAVEGTTPARFTLKRDGDKSANLVVFYTLSGSANGGEDYQNPTGAVMIPAGQTTADVVITTIDDALVEGDESITLTVTGSPSYDVDNPAAATVLIMDNEKQTVTVDTVIASASEPGSDFASFTISRGSVVSGNLAVPIRISGSAIPGTDYVPLDSVVTIPNGSSSVGLDVIVFDDLHREETEQVIVTLVPGTNYNVGNTGAQVLIMDNDDFAVPAVGFSFLASQAFEHESPGISVALSYTSTVPVAVNFRVLGGTATPADYTLGGGQITFEPGESAISLPLSIIDDTIVEADETIRLTLYDPESATHDGYRIHTQTILDNDGAALSVTSMGDAFEAGGVAGKFRITRTGNTNLAQPILVQVTGTASAPSDYTPIGTNVVIPAGLTFVDVPVAAADDGTVELDETVVFTLIGASGCRIAAPRSATLQIIDNDPNALPVVSLSSTNKPYAVEGGAIGEFIISRTGSTASPLNVAFTMSGVAGNGSDFQLLTNGVTIPAGQMAAIVPVLPIDDNLLEGEESVILTLTIQPQYRVAFAGGAAITLQDNEQNVRVEPSDLEGSEPGTDPAAFTFTRFGTTNTPVQVFFTIGGTAGGGTDYSALGNSVTIPAGSLSATLPVLPLDDALVEGPETVTLTLQSHAAYQLGTPVSATVTVQDDEPAFTIVAINSSVTEGAPEPGTFRILRAGDPFRDVTARIALGGTATFGVDYPPFGTNILFNCGVIAVDLPVYPTNELSVEALETVSARLLPHASYTILSPSNAVISVTDAATFRAPQVRLTSPTASPIFLLGTNANIILEAEVIDDGDSNTLVTLLWTNVAGPSDVTFTNTDQAITTASFTNSGVYVLRLMAEENQLTNHVDLTVLVDTLGVLSSNVLRWSFDEGSGTNVSDASGNGRHGVIVGPASWTTNGVTGRALRLNGTNNFVQEAVASGLFNGMKQFTLSMWISATGSVADRGIFAADRAASPTLSLSMRAAASCGIATNTMEATLASDRGDTRRISSGNRFTNGWQQLTLAWSNGLAPALFVNGQLDQPGSQMVPLRGVLTNSAEFLIGKGPL